MVELRLGDCEQLSRPLTLVQQRQAGSCGPLLGRLFLLPQAGATAGLLQGCGGHSVLSWGCGYHQEQLQLLLGCGSDIHRQCSCESHLNEIIKGSEEHEKKQTTQISCTEGIDVMQTILLESGCPVLFGVLKSVTKGTPICIIRAVVYVT